MRKFAISFAAVAVIFALASTADAGHRGFARKSFAKAHGGGYGYGYRGFHRASYYPSYSYYAPSYGYSRYCYSYDPCWTPCYSSYYGCNLYYHPTYQVYYRWYPDYGYYGVCSFYP